MDGENDGNALDDGNALGFRLVEGDVEEDGSSLGF